MMGFPTAAIIGSPLSGWLLDLEVAGLRGWQSLLVIEGLPAVLLGLVAWRVLANRPGEAHWLPAAEAAWLERHVAEEAAQADKGQPVTVRAMLTDPRLILLSTINLLFATCSYAIVFWLPQIIKDLGLGNVEVGLVNAIPFVLGMVLMIWLARRSDRTGERFWHSAAPVFVGAAGLVIAATGSGALFQAVGLLLSYSVLIAFTGTFFVLPSTFLPAQVVAAGVGFVILVGNVGGIIGPYMTGRLKEASEGLSLTLVVLAVILSLAAGLVLVLRRLATTRPTSARQLAAAATPP
jgi:cyanate permease